MEGTIARRTIVDFRIGTTRMTMFPLAEEATTMMVTTIMMVALTITPSNRNNTQGLNSSSSSFHNVTPFATPGSRIPTGPRRRGFRRGGFASVAEGHTLPVGAGPGRHYWCARAVYKDGMVVCCLPLGLGSITGELRARDISFALSNFPQNLENGDQYAEYCVVKMCQK